MLKQGQIRAWNLLAFGRPDIGELFVVMSVRDKEGPVVAILQNNRFMCGLTPEYVTLCSDLIVE